jgi:hypothetical protein
MRSSCPSDLVQDLYPVAGPRVARQHPSCRIQGSSTRSRREVTLTVWPWLSTRDKTGRVGEIADVYEVDFNGRHALRVSESPLMYPSVVAECGKEVSGPDKDTAEPEPWGSFILNDKLARRGQTLTRETKNPPPSPAARRARWGIALGRSLSALATLRPARRPRFSITGWNVNRKTLFQINFRSHCENYCSNALSLAASRISSIFQTQQGSGRFGNRATPPASPPPRSRQNAGCSCLDKWLRAGRNPHLQPPKYRSFPGCFRPLQPLRMRNVRFEGSPGIGAGGDGIE